MTNPIQQIIQTHPEFENMQARFEVEIGGLRQELKEVTNDRDEWQEEVWKNNGRLHIPIIK